MKIRAVCEKTGLTDRTVRYYIEEGLISPSFTENYLGRKSFDFSDQDIAELRDIAVLRNFDFSIEEIRELICAPEKSLEIIKSVKARIGSELHSNQKKLSMLSTLNEQTVYTVAELAEELSRPEEVTPADEEIATSALKRLASAIRVSVFFVAAWLPIVISIGAIAIELVRYEHPIADRLYIVTALLLFLPSVLYMLSSRIKLLQRKKVKGVVFFVCLVCIPISIFASARAVNECGHSRMETVARVEASCTAEGRVVKRCDICRHLVTETAEMLPHTIVTDAGTEATCSNEGMSDGEHCSACGEVFIEQEVIPKKGHSFEKILVEPTCDKDGYTILTCLCGYSYIEDVVFATERHDFVKNGAKGYVCSSCSLEVCEYGFVDGSVLTSEQKMKYYITGRADDVNEMERALVIYGSGEMPAPRYQRFHPWRESVYVEEIKTVIICQGIASIAADAFIGSTGEDSFFGNPFHSVESFIIKEATLTVDPESPDLSGIECDITYLQ